jgi:UDP-3-O-[3-hydroxymyristoyl] glucosamine N-acyltransferase
VANRLADNRRLALLVSDNPRLSFMRLVARHFQASRPAAGIHASAVIDPSAHIHPDASVGAFCHVGKRCRLGEGTVLHPNVTLYDDVKVGRNVLIHSGTVVGADGFGYERNEQGDLEKFPHLGGVVIEDEVEIGSNTSVDRGSLGDTRIGRGAKIDNLVHIAHNVEIGEAAVVIAHSMLGGSARIGTRAWLAPAAIVMNQVSIGAGALVGMGAVVVRDVPEGETVIGAPAVPEAEFKAGRSALKALARGQ